MAVEHHWDTGPTDRATTHRLFLVVQEAVWQCNALAERILGRGELVFSSNFLSRVRMPTLANPELAFIRTVSWLYVQFIEAGGINVRFLQKRFRPYGVEDRNSNLLDLVVCLRTYYQHNLNYEVKRDIAVVDVCEEWFRRVCGTAIPHEPRHYELSLEQLLGSAIEFVGACANCLRGIEIDPDSDVVVNEWRQQRRLDVQPEEFDAIVTAAARDLGMSQVDPVKLRRRFYDQWRTKLQVLRDDSDIAFESRRLVEDALIKMDLASPPVTGSDILALGITPGPRVGELLRLAHRWFADGVKAREEILQRLRDLIEGERNIGMRNEP